MFVSQLPPDLGLGLPGASGSTLLLPGQRWPRELRSRSSGRAPAPPPLAPSLPFPSRGGAGRSTGRGRGGRGGALAGAGRQRRKLSGAGLAALRVAARASGCGHGGPGLPALCCFPADVAACGPGLQPLLSRMGRAPRRCSCCSERVSERRAGGSCGAQRRPSAPSAEAAGPGRASRPIVARGWRQRAAPRPALGRPEPGDSGAAAGKERAEQALGPGTRPACGEPASGPGVALWAGGAARRRGLAGPARRPVRRGSRAARPLLCPALRRAP